MAESSRWHTRPVSITTAISLSTVFTLAITASLASDRTTPYEIIVEDGNFNRVHLALIQLEVAVVGHWVFEETLADSTSSDTFSTLVAIAIRVASCA